MRVGAACTLQAAKLGERIKLGLSGEVYATYAAIAHGY